MKVQFSGSTYAQTLGLNTDTGVGIGAANAYANRAYDNGYVGLAPSTGNPSAIDPNTTWNWGYNNAGQYNAGAGSLSFQKQGVPRYSALADGGSGGKDEMLGTGLQLLLSAPLKQSGKWSVDLVFGFQGIWGAEAKYSENAGYFNVTDTYDVSGIPAASFPAAGHHGTYGGPFDPAATPPYTIIPNLPGSRAAVPGAPALATAQSSVAFDVNQSLYQLSVGPQIGLAVSKRLTLNARPTISVNIIDVDVERSETFMFGDGSGAHTWKDSAGDREVYLGLGITVGANYDLGKGWFTGVFGGYEWVMEKVNISVGPNTVTADASGWTAGFTVGKSF